MKRHRFEPRMELLDYIIGAYIFFVAAILIALGWSATTADGSGGPATPATTQNAPVGPTGLSKRPSGQGNSLPSLDNRLRWEECRAHVLNPEDCNVPSGFEYVPGKGLLEVTNGRG